VSPLTGRTKRSSDPGPSGADNKNLRENFQDNFQENVEEIFQAR
jgi:hypothetical protein